jgi:putative transposase
MCRLLGVSRSGYHAWEIRPISKRQLANEELGWQITEIHAESRGTYGYRRVRAELGWRGVCVSAKRVRRLMGISGLEGCKRRRFRGTTRVNSTTFAPDLVQRNFCANRPDELWWSDITYIHTNEGWLYLASVMDAFSRKVIGWSMSERIDTKLVLDATNAAITSRRPTQVTHHLDHGCQYTSIAFTKRCKDVGVVASMGTIADCFDNAAAESFWATLKTEVIYRQKFETRQHARSEIFSYIEGWYNEKRLHSTLGYMSPNQFERMYQLQEANV